MFYWCIKALIVHSTSIENMKSHKSIGKSWIEYWAIRIAWTSFIVPLQMDLILSELSSIFMSFLWTFTAVINPLCHKNCTCQPVKILSFQEGHIFDVTREFYTFHSFDLIEMENAVCGLDVSMLRYLVELRCSWTNGTLWIRRFRDSQD